MLPSGIELWVVLAVIVLLFGTKKLPELGTGLGKFINNFRSSYRDSKTLDVTPDKSAEENPRKKD